jgi:hypothetical protein
LRLAEQIELLNPVVNVFRVRLVKSEEVLVNIEVVLANKLL